MAHINYQSVAYTRTPEIALLTHILVAAPAKQKKFWLNNTTHLSIFNILSHMQEDWNESAEKKTEQNVGLKIGMKF